MNRINEPNSKTTQNDPLIASWTAKTVPREPKSSQEQPKTSSRQLKSRPRPSKEGPRAPKTTPRPPQDDPRPPLEPSWFGLGAILRAYDHKIEKQVVPGQIPSRLWIDFGSQNGLQNNPKSTPNRDTNQNEKCITFLSLLDPSWSGLEAILGPSWGQKSVFSFTFSNVS